MRGRIVRSDVRGVAIQSNYHEFRTAGTRIPKEPVFQRRCTRQVNTGIGPPAALIVDDDVAFILWLGEMFTANGYQAYPALNCRHALALARKLALEIDVLVLNPKLRGAARTMEVLSSAVPTCE